MSTVRVAVLKAPGTNCDLETIHAFELAGAQAQRVWVDELKDKKDRLDPYHILVIPGGFSYGDDLGAGRILANTLAYEFREWLEPFLKQEKLVIGICNGFQVLAKSGILPAGTLAEPQSVTLTGNDSGKFEDRWVYLKSEVNVCVWTQGAQCVNRNAGGTCGGQVSSER